MHAKLKKKRHMKNLPSSNAPFSKIHMDTLEISPPRQQGYLYVLVLVDDFSWFNHIYLMTEKSKAEYHVKAFLNELYNKTELIPTYIHTDRGGEFDSKVFKSMLHEKGISLERGPPDLPQANGVAERFNHNLLSKIQCLLGQLKIPI
ncbi:hypothetical protein O181_097343 [Austropuccinia psidii MF-1]|uniref:Integrase catalytic domain-containing protein n=1 Tax=Austropuccinia psidii MF-1 TaxID=1389203 RepID=A0A9Q3PD37_9BASI|nr:hypothetical protein [Austropuccinia psidii MF-1]